VTTRAKKELKEENKKIVDEIRNRWNYKSHISTVPSWGQTQNKIIQLCKTSLPDVDEETKKKITRELLLTLRCHSCERARSDECNFSVCIRGLMSGRDIGGIY
jgi:ribosomal protein L44E